MALKLGLFLGINDYPRLSEARLGCAEADAEALSELFVQRFGYETQVLLGGDVTQDRIRDTLELWKERFKAAYGGRLVVYFAGHGVTTDQAQTLLLTSNALERDLKNTRNMGPGIIPLDWLVDETKDWPNVKTSQILDACRTPLNRRLDLPPEARARDMGANPARRGSGPQPDLTILHSCQPDQLAVELSGYDAGAGRRNHGIFTAAFLDVATHKADLSLPFVLEPRLVNEIQASIRQLVPYVPEALRPEAKAQTPMLAGKINLLADQQDYALAGARQRDERIIQRARELGSLSEWRHARDTLSAGSPFHEEVDRAIAEATHREDDAAWAKALEQPGRAAYLAYLKDYPTGRHAGDAKAALAMLDRADDDAAWHLAAKENTETAYARYLDEWPEGHYRDEAQDRFQALKQGRLDAEEQARSEADTHAWEQARQKDTPADYLREYPNGRYRKAAEDLQQEIDADHAAWKAAEGDDTEAGYTRYLNDHPQGRHRQDALQRRDARQAERQADDQAWRRACQDDDEAAYAKYLTDYPKGIHRDDAANRLHDAKQTRLKREQIEKENKARLEFEHHAWRKADEQGTAEAYQAYLDDFPEGLHREEAQTGKQDALAWENALEENSEYAYQRYLQQFPKGRHHEAATKYLDDRRNERLQRDQRKQELEEERIWQQATDGGTLEHYEVYLGVTRLKHHETEAQQAIQRLKDADLKARERDAARWRKAMANPSIESLSQFIREQETDAYSVQAHQELNRLRQIKKQEDEEASLWRKADNLHTIESLLAYLESSTLKTYAWPARRAIARLWVKKYPVMSLAAIWIGASLVLAPMMDGGNRIEPEPFAPAPAPEAAAPVPAAPAAVPSPKEQLAQARRLAQSHPARALADYLSVLGFTRAPGARDAKTEEQAIEAIDQLFAVRQPWTQADLRTLQAAAQQLGHPLHYYQGLMQEDLGDLSGARRAYQRATQEPAGAMHKELARLRLEKLGETTR